jgi:transcriptional regulator with XRE-family HTH domain
VDRLAELRESQALTLRDLAERSGVDANTINQVELGHRKPRPSTLRKLAKALDVDVRELFEEPALSGKAEAPREAGPTLLDKALDAVRHDEKKDLHARARLDASEGTGQEVLSYEEDKFRAVLRARGYPEEDFESFIWPLIVKARRAEQLEEENARLRKEAEQETVHR